MGNAKLFEKRLFRKGDCAMSLMLALAEWAYLEIIAANALLLNAQIPHCNVVAGNELLS